MTDPTRYGVAAYQSKPRNTNTREDLLRLMSTGWATANTIMGVAGALEATAAASAALGTGALAELSLATKFSIYTLPLSAFMLGVTLRDWGDHRNDDDDDNRLSAVHIIMLAAFREAVDNHFKYAPNSKIRDETRISRLMIFSGNKFSNINMRLALLYERWSKALSSEIDQQQHSFWKGRDSPLYGTDWRTWVLTRFTIITSEYGALLGDAERVSRSHY